MALLFKRSNGIYYTIEIVNGKQVWRSTGVKNKVAASIIAQNFSPSDTPAPKELTLSGFAPQFRIYAETNLAKPTITLYRYAYRMFIDIVGDRPLKSYSARDAERFKSVRLQTVSPVKVNIDFRNIASFFRNALRWKLIDEFPFEGVKQIRVPQQRPTYLSKEDFYKLHEQISTQWFKDLVTFAVCTMMRLGEIVNLKWEHIDFKNKLIRIENSEGFRVKSGKARVVPMNTWVFSFLFMQGNKQGYVFTFPGGRPLSVHYVSQSFKKYVRRTEIDQRIHFHSLRHTGATWLVQDGVSIYEVQKLLGHSNIAITQIYSHLHPEELHSAINRISLNVN